MGKLDDDGKTLTWEEVKEKIAYIKEHGIIQFLNIFHDVKNRDRDELLWGDEIEYYILKVDDENKTVKLSLRSHELIDELNKDTESLQILSWKPEYGHFMIEATPANPFTKNFNDLLKVEENMLLRRDYINKYLHENERVISLTNFPYLGVGKFTSPEYDLSNNEFSNSIYTPDQCIDPHPRFSTLTRNIRVRKGSKVAINIPLFMDKNTKPLKYDEEFPNGGPALENHIYMDSMAFGMGMCCLQATFQCWNIGEARHLYDSFIALSPIMLALTAACPIFRGYLSDYDVRWEVISKSVDDRTPEELGLVPLKENKFRISKSRYDSVSTYISEDPRLVPELNDIELVYDEDVFNQLVKNGVDERLAKHYAHLFIRDPLVVYDNKVELDDKTKSDHFENIQSTNWQTVRFKPPPPQSPIGWRVEFRPMEIQFTDFENAAFVIFNVLFTRVVLSFDLNMYVPISKVDENMKNAYKRGATLNQKFWFRNDLSSDSKTDVNTFELMTVNEIINGSDKFRGIIPLIKRYLESTDIDIEVKCKVNQYLRLISNRASGKLINEATWIRNFVQNHPDYKFDSVITESINYDLIQAILGLQTGETSAPELLGKDFVPPRKKN